MRQPTDDELDAIRDEIAWGRIEGDTYILPAIAEYVLKLVAERDAALAEIERLRTMLDKAMGVVENYYDQLEAWRACADRLATSMDYQAWTPMQREALAEYERLRRGEILDRMSEHAEEQGLS